MRYALCALRIYRPSNFGFRFSRKAAIPSFLSSVPNSIQNTPCSICRPSLREVLMPFRIAVLAARRATAGRSINFSARAVASASKLSEGTILLTKPMRSALSALMVSPKKMSSAANESPTRRGRRCVPPPPGMIPRLISGKPNTALSAAILKSHQRATSHPPPKA